MKHAALPLCIALCINVSPASALAQADEPFFGPQPAPAPADQARDPEPSSRGDARPPSARVSRGARRGTFHAALGATAGYAYYHNLIFSEFSLHGPMISGQLDLTWPTEPARVGVRIKGSYAPKVFGETTPFLSGTEYDVEAQALSLHAALLAELGGFSASFGLGFTHIYDVTKLNLPPSYGVDEAQGDAATVPEGELNLGYTFWLGDHLGLRLGGEVGTCYFLTWRLSAGAGLMLRI